MSEAWQGPWQDAAHARPALHMPPQSDSSARWPSASRRPLCPGGQAVEKQPPLPQAMQLTVPADYENAEAQRLWPHDEGENCAYRGPSRASAVAPYLPVAQASGSLTQAEALNQRARLPWRRSWRPATMCALPNEPHTHAHARDISSYYKRLGEGHPAWYCARLLSLPGVASNQRN